MSVEIQTMGEGGIFEIAAVVIDEVLEIQPFTDVEYEILSSARDILAADSILEAATVATNSANTAAGLVSEAATAANDAAGLANSAATSATSAAGAANTAAGLASEAATAANDAAGLANSATTSANTAAGAANSAATSATSAAGAANTAAGLVSEAATAANDAAGLANSAATSATSAAGAANSAATSATSAAGAANSAASSANSAASAANDAAEMMIFSNGTYPDIPINRVTIKRYSEQGSHLYVYEDNTSLMAKILALCKPVLLNRDSLIDTYLSGSNCLKSADGYPANLTNWDKPAMTLIGGFWQKYEYNASTNEKIIKISPYKVVGYKYVRRRYVGMFNGNTVTNSADGANKTFLCSNYDVYTTQTISLANAHSYAKNLGTHFRAMADQDLDVYALLFSLFKGTVHTQGVYEGITNVNSTKWASYNKSADGGASSQAQFHKNGATIGLTSHEGEVSLSVTDFPGGAITVKPNRFLWRENGLAGPYYLFTSGRLIIDNVVWQVNDLANIAFTKTDDYVQLCSLAGIAPSVDGWQRILETYQNTLMPSAIGGSDTTGMCDQWNGLAADNAGGVYVPARLGAASRGARAGLRCLDSNYGPSSAGALCGVSLASDDPTDTIADGTIAN